MGRLVKLLGSGIGLASEAISARKASHKATTTTLNNAGEGSSRAVPGAPVDDAPPEYVEVPDDTADELIASGKAVPADVKDHHIYDQQTQHEGDEDDDISEEGDEEQWELDEAVSYPEPSEDAPAEDISLLTDTFMRDHPPPAYTPSETGQVKGRLPCPVIIPQRRPRDKKRGFVRAYAPMLADCGIDQATFLDFLQTFHASTQEDKWLNVVFLGAGVVGMVPGPITMGVSISIQVAVGVSMEVQRRYRTNSFLDRMNNEFFKPRGLYCLIMTYKPDSTETHGRVDITETVFSSMEPASSSTKQTFKNLRLSSGKTYGELELPEAAPLIFPALDSISTAEKQSKLKSSKNFVADYFDRRAQAEYAAENPGSKLTVQGSEPAFKSRFADPNHPANSGSLISLLTGGHLNPADKRQRRRGARRVRRAYRKGDEITPATSQKRGKKDGVVRRMLKKNVLYLMIVNLPSEEELKIGRDAVANEEAENEL